MGLFLSFRIFCQYYPELFPPSNITVMRKQSGTPKVRVFHDVKPEQQIHALKLSMFCREDTHRIASLNSRKLQRKEVRVSPPPRSC